MKKSLDHYFPLSVIVLGAVFLTGCPIFGLDTDIVGRWRIADSLDSAQELEFTSSGEFIERFTSYDAMEQPVVEVYRGTYTITPPKTLRMTFLSSEYGGVQEDFFESFTGFFIFELINNGSTLRLGIFDDDRVLSSAPPSFSGPGVLVYVYQRQ